MRIAAEAWLPAPGRGPIVPFCDLTCDARGISATPSRDRNAGLGRLALPAPVNAHDHGYGIRTLDFGCADDALEPWIAALRQRPKTDPYLEALVAFGRVARSGCGGTVHCHNSLNVAHLVDEADAVVRAARDCGIRLALSCPLLDASPFVYGGIDALAPGVSAADRDWLRGLVPAYAPVAEQIAAVDAIAASHAGPLVDVQFGPIAPQWASDAMLAAVAEASATHGRRVHMHLLESLRQRHWLDRRFAEGVVHRLDAIGLLSPRLTVAHGVWLRADEAALLAERGVRLVSNPSANLRLRSGILPDGVTQAMDCAIGLDGTGFDDAQDIWHEMRLYQLLHAGRGLTSECTTGEVFEAVSGVGASVAGYAGQQDLVCVDWAHLRRDAVLEDDDPATRLLARMSHRHVTGLVVAGREVVHNRRLTGFDFEAARGALVEQARADRGAMEQRRATARRLAGLIRQHYTA